MHQNLFTDDKVDFKVLRERATGMRWGALPEDVIPLTAADPDFRPAQEIRDAMIEYIKGGYFPYPTQTGMPGLRESIARGQWERNGVRVNPDFVLPVDSAAAALHAIATSILKPGDEAIIFDPVDLLFGISVRYAGAKEICYPSIRENGGWKLDDLEDYITPKTRMICLCNPHNPMGYVYTEQELRHIAEVANRHNLWIMNDEIWSDIIYSESKFTSINTLGAELNQRTITCYGFSKGFALPGLRAGYIYTMGKEAYDTVTRVANGSSYGVDVITQVAMKAAYDNAFYWVDAFREHLQGIRDTVYERFSKMPLIKATKQQATFVTFPDISATGMTSKEFADYSLNVCRVAIVPGTVEWFGPRGAGHVRFCYATSHAIINEAMDRIERGLKAIADKLA
ncbi:pyridoxal phosphate-dependent aminotransferase [Feifania hominis]|uniref:Aminotransferase n=1 Tax=Feifania hominis TaxID=2763660 RepID=A0A926HV53_9FIRM|nr:pyridoxal phosphate-dependent aminotransferase [Feifania hominis]MBC8536241.1 pyridoxal phosphate-dependent aminotransferase [Feifania hominis]